MNYAIEVLQKELSLVESGIKTFSDKSKKEYSEHYKSVLNRKNDLTKAIELINGKKQLTIFDNQQ